MARAIWDRTRVSRAQALAIVQEVFDGTLGALVTAGRMELRNFGLFEVKPRSTRKARNPRTVAPVSVPERAVLIMKAGQEMLLRIRQIGPHPIDDGAPSLPYTGGSSGCARVG
jgi:nucleoid DNA-binding protein